MPLPDQMLAIAITASGDPDVLQPTRLPLPSPAPGEVLIRVAAAGVNAPDLGQRRGTYAPPPGASPLPGLEVAGVVAARSVEAGFAEGDRVVALTNGGGYAEYVAVPAGQVLPLPPNWSLAAGAALPETFFTIQQTLVMRAGLAAGMDVLVHGAAGGLGGAAIQIAKVLGARPIAVVSSDEKAAYAARLGAAATIDHIREDVVARTRELTGGKGADLILEMAGGPSLVNDIEAAARGGHIVVVAALSGAPSPISAGKLVMKQLTLSGSTLRPQPAATKAAIARNLLEHVWPALGDGRIVRPRLRALPLVAAARAHEQMERRENYGKLVLLTDFGMEMLAAEPDNSIESA